MTPRAYYNEIDPEAAQSLRDLMDAGFIAPGDVDERSIEDVAPQDLNGYTQCHFFAGIGIWSMALRRAGWSDFRPVWTGSCPCQPFSSAGKGDAFDDPRHLFPAWFHLIAECRPVDVFGEQVAGKDGLAWLDIVQADMERAGYALGVSDTCAAGFGAPHIRQRLYFHAADHRRFAASGVPHADREQRHGAGDVGSRGRLEFANGGLPRVVVNGVGTGLEGHGGHGDNCGQPRRLPSATVGPITTSGLPSALVDDGRGGCHPGVTGNAGTAEGARGERGDVLARSSGAGALADHQRGNGGQDDQVARGCGEGSGTQGVGQRSASGGTLVSPGPINGFWRDADWLKCRDERWRPVEPGTFPLANGIAGRAGKLRCFGNGIVLPQAEEIIRAVM